MVNVKVYPILGFNQVYWVSKDKTTGFIAISQYSEFKAEVFCKMELGRFPFDKQTCILEVCTTNTI